MQHVTGNTVNATEVTYLFFILKKIPAKSMYKLRFWTDFPLLRKIFVHLRYWALFDGSAYETAGRSLPAGPVRPGVMTWRQYHFLKANIHQ